ncbi:hypothetical protein M427DRAFT_57021 [Gonapodya prolifera JEL478]|uniref:PEHE domain-containing protein n=1 Tax=Gonapodya prolifera (strain JEL478) TaxID=1344416 RepID=A0A139AE99_GONPJ|nr:hypothetical protein M427DRAFT_57021 [Gonapodya prolifera JEL478]|eukprot:KXS15146.1 hypothetical protein M427DRAFT_57021 [Gonapodya prolifera JEL478]
MPRTRTQPDGFTYLKGTDGRITPPSRHPSGRQHHQTSSAQSSHQSSKLINGRDSRKILEKVDPPTGQSAQQQRSHPVEKPRRRPSEPPQHTTTTEEHLKPILKRGTEEMPPRHRTRDPRGDDPPPTRRTLRSNPQPPPLPQPTPIILEPQRNLKNFPSSKRPSEETDSEDPKLVKSSLGKRKRAEEREYGGPGYESGHETDNGERRKLRPRRIFPESTRARERELLFQLIRPDCFVLFEDDEAAGRTYSPILLPPSLPGAPPAPVPVPLPPPKQPDGTFDIPMFRLLEFPRVGKGKKVRKPTWEDQDEDTSDEAYELRHRRYEREEKRLKNREVEVYRYELHKRREAEEARKQQEISRMLVTGGRSWSGVGGGTASGSAATGPGGDDEGGRMKPPKRPGIADIPAPILFTVVDVAPVSSLPGSQSASRRVSERRTSEEYVGRSTRSGAKYRSARTL